MNRREAIRLMAAGLAVACASPTKEPSSPVPTRVENLSPLEQLEQRVKTAGFTIWKDLLTTSQEGQAINEEQKPYIKANYLDMNVANMSALAKVYEQVLKPGAKPTDIPIKASWVYLFAGENYGPYVRGPLWKKFYGDKWIGEVEFDKISIQTVGAAPTDPASIANGMEWQGSIQLKFIQRTRSLLEKKIFEGESLRSEFNQWVANTTPSEELQRFTDWQNGEWGFKLIVRNGQLQRENILIGMGKIEVPTKALLSCEFAQGCKTIYSKA